jgi:hypothetical protein
MAALHVQVGCSFVMEAAAGVRESALKTSEILRKRLKNRTFCVQSWPSGGKSIGK